MVVPSTFFSQSEHFFMTTPELTTFLTRQVDGSTFFVDTTIARLIASLSPMTYTKGYIFFLDHMSPEKPEWELWSDPKLGNSVDMGQAVSQLGQYPLLGRIDKTTLKNVMKNHGFSLEISGSQNLLEDQFPLMETRVRLCQQIHAKYLNAFRNPATGMEVLLFQKKNK